MNKLLLFKIFLRSFFIQATLNFRRMQNLGFTMTIIPVIREWNLTKEDAGELLTRHLQLFNTHPYLSAPVIGSVLKLEEDHFNGSHLNTADIITVKQVLSGPYAAIGDTFFWGALRPFAAMMACVLAYAGNTFAPLAFLLLYTPSHLWVRAKGFWESYRRGKQGVEFVRMLDLPNVAVRMRWFSLILLSGTALFLISGSQYSSFVNLSGMMTNLAAIAVIMVCFLLVKKRISQVYIFYAAALLFLLISSLKEI